MGSSPLVGIVAGRRNRRRNSESSPVVDIVTGSEDEVVAGRWDLHRKSESSPEVGVVAESRSRRRESESLLDDVIVARSLNLR